MVFDDYLKRGRTLRIAVETLMIFLVFVGGAGALSNGGGGSWAYSRDITISNPGSALSNYQMLVNLTGAAFSTGAKADGQV